jgi:spermidine/putrescine transport system substrate-binding protein
MDVNAQFEREFGVTVNYKTYESNESMYTLLESGAAEYDVVIPSEYMIGKMIQEDMLAKLNFDNIPNYQYIDKTYTDILNQPYEGTDVSINDYCVPYTWGTVGIFYNKKYVDEADLAQGWDILWNPKYAGKIYMFDNARDSFAIALKKLGYSMNTQNPDEWQAAYDELAKQKPLVQGYFMDQVFQKMTNEEGWLAPYYSGDGANMITGDDGNENIGYFVPDQGTNLFVDAMCVLKTSKNKELAEKYINFMCRSDVATANAEYICYSTPHTEALSMLSEEVAIANAEYICYASPNRLVYENEDYIAYMEEEVHPNAIDILYNFDMENMEFYHDLSEETRNMMNSLWEELKIESTSDVPVYITCVVIVAALAAFFTARGITQYKRRKYY